MLELLQHNQLLLGGLLIGGLTTIFYSLKQVPEKIFDKLKDRFIFRVVVYDYDELFYVLENWFGKNHPKKCRNMEVSFEQTRKWVHGIDDDAPQPAGNKRIRKLFWKQEPNIFTLKFQGRRLFISKDKKELDHATDLRSMLNFHYSVRAWRGKKVVQQFLQQITEDYNKSMVTGKLSIYVSASDGSWHISGKRTVKTIDRVVLPVGVKSFITEDLDKFRNGRDWYHQINVVYKRSYLLYGPPGTGKTTIAQAMAAYLGKDICSLNLNSVTSDAMLVNLFTHIPDNTLLLIEDIDCVFVQRKPVSKDTKITFSCLLNCLDGVISKENILTVITTNHVDKLDPALVRAGRVDVQLEIPYAGNPEIEEYLEIFYGRRFSIGDDPVQVNMSAVQESCIQYQGDPGVAISKILELNKLVEVLS